MSSKKKNRPLRMVILVFIALAVVVGIGWLFLTNYFASSAAPIEDAALASASEVVPVPEISDEELSKLLSGETTLQELESSFTTESPSASTGEQAPSEGESASSVNVAPENASASSGSNTEPSSKASSGSTSATPAAASETSSSGGDASHTASSAETVQEAAYEAEIKALLQELYTLRARAMSDLNAIIASAKAEFKALPEEQQTQARKVSIVFSKAGQLTSLQSYYDKEVERIVGEIRKILSENGQSTQLADQAMASYKSQKNEKYAELINKLYKKSE